MKNPNTVKSAWTTPELAVYGKVKDLTQDEWWKTPGGGDGVVICIDDSAVSVSTCPPGSC